MCFCCVFTFWRRYSLSAVHCFFFTVSFDVTTTYTVSCNAEICAKFHVKLVVDESIQPLPYVQSLPRGKSLFLKILKLSKKFYCRK